LNVRQIWLQFVIACIVMNQELMLEVHFTLELSNALLNARTLSKLIFCNIEKHMTFIVSSSGMDFVEII
jgi:hypothetical protein